MTPVDTSAEAVERVAAKAAHESKLFSRADYDEAAALLRAIAKERDQLRDTNRRLNQRCQAAEASLPDYRKIIAVPPDGDGVRFVSGNLGRALAVTMCAKLDDQLAEQEVLLAERNRQNAAAFTASDAYQKRMEELDRACSAMRAKLLDRAREFMAADRETFAMTADEYHKDLGLLVRFVEHLAGEDMGRKL